MKTVEFEHRKSVFAEIMAQGGTLELAAKQLRLNEREAKLTWTAIQQDVGVRQCR